MTTQFNETTTTIGRNGISHFFAEANRIVHAALLAKNGNHEPMNNVEAASSDAEALLAYKIGYKAFMGIELIAAKGVLVPREETELLGNTALNTLRSCGSSEPRVIDMCCGSGNLACAIAHHIPGAKVWASDITDECISVTRRNVEHVGVSDRVTIAQGDLFSGLTGLVLNASIDVVICNPPYISQGKLATDSSVLCKHEPRAAFDGGPYGLTIQQRVIKEALPFLRPGGLLIFEIGLGQARQVKMLFERVNAYEDIQLVENSSGEVRVVSGRKRGVQLSERIDAAIACASKQHDLTQQKEETHHEK